MLIKRYLEQVTGVIRSKEAKKHVEAELTDHLHRAKQSWIEKGVSYEESEHRAIQEMGSPLTLGKSMDQIHKPKWDYWLIGLITLLLIASFLPRGTNYLDGKVINIAVALLVITFFMFIDYRKLQRLAWLLYSISIAYYLLILYTPNYYYYGIIFGNIGPFHLHAWLMLPCLIIALTSFFSERQMNGWLLMVIVLIPSYLLLALPSLSVLLLYNVVVVSLFINSYFSKPIKKRTYKVARFFIVLSIIGGFFIYKNRLQSYQVHRFEAWLHPEKYSDTSGYVILQLKAALQNSSWIGGGRGVNVPASHTEFALVEIVQSYGTIVGALIISILIAVCARIYYHARNLPQSFGKQIVMVSSVFFAAQSVYSILMVLGVLPLQSISLPFISYGLSPFVMNAIFIGLVLSVYRRKSFIEQPVSNK